MLRSNFLAAATALALAAPGIGAEPPDPSRARIEGVVVDEAGRPVAGAFVRVPGYGRGDDPDPVRTGPDGRFRFVLRDALAHGRCVLASADGGARQGLARTQYWDLRPVVDLRMNLKPSRDVTVRVLDGHRKPVPGAFVTALTFVTLPVAGTDTDAAGVAHLQLAADMEVDQIVGVKAGLGFDYYEVATRRSGRKRIPLPAEVTLVLDGTRPARVRVTDSRDRPLPDIAVVPWTIKRKGKGDEANLSGCAALPRLAIRTDGTGVATFDWLPLDPGGGVTFLAVSQQHHEPDSPYLEPARQDRQLTTRLLRNVGAGGKVMFPDGRPAPGILLQAEGCGATNHYFRGYARTGADGSYAFHLYPEQTYILAVIDDDWAAPSHVGLAVKEGQELKGLDFRLCKGTVLEGRVTVGPAKKPMAGQGISVMQQGPGTKARLYRGALTDADGRYRTRLGPGTFRLSGPGNEAEELVVRDEPRIEKDFALPRPLTGPLHVRVVARDTGRPVPRATVIAESADSSGRGGIDAAVADEQGRLDIEQRWLARA
jgi:hypothetical protein